MPTATRSRRTPPPPPSEPEIPPMDSTTEKRTKKMEQLETAVESIYTIIYGALVVAPGPIGVKTKPIGVRLKEYTPQIAGAWVDLAEEDDKVKRVLESFANIGGWGKVIGLHLYVVGGQMLPAFAGMNPPQQGGQGQSQEQGGVSLDDLMALANFMQQGAAQERAQGNGAEQVPPRQAQQQPQPQPPPPMPPQPAPSGTMARPAAGIPSPQELGVQVPDLPVEFPAGSAQDVKGK